MNNQMNKKKAGVAFIALLTCALACQALAQGPEYKSNADDLAKIRSINAWLGKESGKPVHTVTEDTDLTAELKRGLSYVRSEKPKKKR
jgi:hypothetical protein